MSNSISNYSNYTLNCHATSGVTLYIYVLAFYRKNIRIFYIKNVPGCVRFFSRLKDN